MARAKFQHLVVDDDGNVQTGVSVQVYQPGTQTPVGPIYANPSGGAPISLPLVSDASGYVECYTDTPQRVDAVYSGATVRSQFDPDPATLATLTTDFVTTAGAQTVGGQKTFTSPILLPDGAEALPALAFASGPDHGLRWISTNKWAAVVDGQDWLRFRSGSVLREMKLGNVDFLAPTTLARAIPLHIQVQTTDPNDLIIGLHTEVTNNATAPFTGTHPTNTPDSAAITAVFYQSEATAVGAFRSLEVHGTRSRPGAGSGVLDSAMAGEIGIHTAASGNASFGTGTAVPKTMGIWLSSYADTLMVGQGETAVPADVGLYITGPLGGGGGAGGFRYPIFYHTNANVIGFYINDQGHVRTGVDNNQASVGYGFVGENGLGMFYGGAGVLAWATADVERMRLNSDGLGIKRAPAAATALSVQGNSFLASGAAGTLLQMQLGRATADATFGIAGAATQLAAGSAQGDLIIRSESQKMLLGSGGTEALTITAARSVLIGTAAIATNATDGFLYLPTCAGAPSGTPTAAAGRVALVFDTTNNKLMAYDGGWIGVVLS